MPVHPRAVGDLLREADAGLFEGLGDLTPMMCLVRDQVRDQGDDGALPPLERPFFQDRRPHDLRHGSPRSLESIVQPIGGRRLGALEPQ